MFIELEGLRYAIKFQYENDATLATLWKDVGDGFESTGNYGFAMTHYSDTFVKKVGRKIAFTRLLKNMQEEGRFVLTKEIRKQIWEEYFKKHKR